VCPVIVNGSFLVDILLILFLIGRTSIAILTQLLWRHILDITYFETKFVLINFIVFLENNVISSCYNSVCVKCFSCLKTINLQLLGYGGRIPLHWLYQNINNSVQRRLVSGQYFFTQSTGEVNSLTIKKKQVAAEQTLCTVPDITYVMLTHTKWSDIYF
jgi:hypothetical protein